MLDKSVPYAGLLMCRKAGTPIPDFSLPDGFGFSLFNEGDEIAWARIEASIHEFDSEFAALMFFKENFIPHAEELCRRCLFVETEEGEKVATATAWWAHVEGQRRPWVHWVGVAPEYQELGLGKAIIARVTELATQLDGDVEIHLKTQSWSYRAIGIYRLCGYEPTDEKVLYKSLGNNYRKATRILKRLKRDGLFRG